MTDFETVDYYFDQSPVADPYPHYDNLFDTNNNASHLTFGKGVDANLARLEGRVALDELLNRWPERDTDHTTARLAPTFTVPKWDYLRMISA